MKITFTNDKDEIINRLKMGQSFYKIAYDLHYNAIPLKRYIDTNIDVQQELLKKGIVIEKGVKHKPISVRVPEQCKTISDMIKVKRREIYRPFAILFSKIEQNKCFEIANYIQKYGFPLAFEKYKYPYSIMISIARTNALQNVYKYLLINFSYSEEIRYLLSIKFPISQIAKRLKISYMTVKNYASLFDYPKYNSKFIKYV